MLNTKEVVELYKILAPHLPEESPTQALNYIGDIVNSIIEKERHSDFTDAIMLIHGKTIQELDEMKTTEILHLFVKGLEENKVLSLHKFMQEVGFNA